MLNTLKHILLVFFCLKQERIFTSTFITSLTKSGDTSFIYSINDSSTFLHTTASFSPCSTENRGIRSAHLCSPFLHQLLLVHLLGWCVLWGGGGVSVGWLGIKLFQMVRQLKGSAGNTICFLTRKHSFVCWPETGPAKLSSVGEKLNRLCRRVILEKGNLPNRVHGIVYRRAEW